MDVCMMLLYRRPWLQRKSGTWTWPIWCAVMVACSLTADSQDPHFLVFGRKRNNPKTIKYIFVRKRNWPKPVKVFTFGAENENEIRSRDNVGQVKHTSVSLKSWCNLPCCQQGHCRLKTWNRYGKAPRRYRWLSFTLVFMVNYDYCLSPTEIGNRRSDRVSATYSVRVQPAALTLSPIP